MWDRWRREVSICSWSESESVKQPLCWRHSSSMTQVFFSLYLSPPRQPGPGWMHRYSAYPVNPDGALRTNAVTLPPVLLLQKLPVVILGHCAHHTWCIIVFILLCLFFLQLQLFVVHLSVCSWIGTVKNMFTAAQQNKLSGWKVSVKVFTGWDLQVCWWTQSSLHACTLLLYMNMYGTFPRPNMLVVWLYTIRGRSPVTSPDVTKNAGLLHCLTMQNFKP